MKTRLVYILAILFIGAACASLEAGVQLELAWAGGVKTAAAAAAPPPPTGAVFLETLELQGIRFQVSCTNEGSLNTLSIVPAGLEIDNSPIVQTVDGSVSGAEAADLNGDGSPEIYVYVTSAGSGSYGSLAAYSANRRKSLSDIYLPPLEQDKAASKGYMGHDEFAVEGRYLLRRFPVYRVADTNSRPTGGKRLIYYQLVPGEAGWVLKIDRVVDP
jgi:hypothetical protein